MSSLYRINGSRLDRIKRGHLPTEDMIEGWIEGDPTILGLEVMMIGRQVLTPHRGRIDLLAIDRIGELIVIELKRDRTHRDVVAQVLDYASWVTTLNTSEVYEIAEEYSGSRLDLAFRERFGAPIPEELNSGHKLLIVATELDAGSKRIVEYLSEQHRLNINTLFFEVFEDHNGLLMSANWQLDDVEVSDRADRAKKAPWRGYWYVNVGDDESRSWEDMRRYGFLSAGNGQWYSDALTRLSEGDPVFAYQKNRGYVGYGIVTGERCMVRDFEVNGAPLLEQQLKQPNVGHDRDDPELAEYAVPIDWRQTYTISEAKTFEGVFANQNIVCKLTHPATVSFLENVFEASTSE